VTAGIVRRGIDNLLNFFVTRRSSIGATIDDFMTIRFVENDEP